MLPHISRRDLRLASGLILFGYVGTHLANHALGLVSLDTAEAALVFSVEFWGGPVGTVVLYAAAAVHVTLAIEAIYVRRTFRLPPIELLRIGLGLWLPVLLIGHAVTARLEFELVGSPTTYHRVVTGLWASNSEWRQIGLLAPGWLHGCLGLRLAFGHRPVWRRLQLPLFAVALLLPVLSALGFLAMGRDLARAGPPAPVAASTQEARATLNRWREDLLGGYLGLIGFAVAARSVRNMIERRGRKLVTIAYPNRTVTVPRGWSVLDASRAFHVAHASSCGGRARCSTCRVRVVSGDCPPPAAIERATLARIAAPPEVRLACQLRPDRDVSVVPLVRTDRPVYRSTPVAIDNDRTVVLLFCDFANRTTLARDHLAHDVLFAFTRHAETACDAVVAAGGTVSYVEHDSICAVFGLDTGVERASRAALATTAGIEQSLADLNSRLGAEWGCQANIVVSLHAGRAALGRVGHTGTIVAAGEALDAAEAIRRAVIAAGKAFAVSGPVIAAAGLPPPTEPALRLTRTSSGWTPAGASDADAAADDRAIVPLPVYLLDTVAWASDGATWSHRVRHAAAAARNLIQG
ncbi:MAG: 2Fe-2S iron-sulfur cluster binding domain-containing protein [Rhodoplanes sp.]|uniref:2Fe-2S iron-sulfur cluster-binding protein n=1 Tax=Rhodoplanes sp. TaxID=1968906 RepID=UPI0017AFE975|nr:2Fe-2S iron-sulfur cluster-binding protein [Rhodoplanes sp.]NVO14139.1 2Fe-2S iron-sulfur cluster binding domain-containing protein [Rhodoplanes sp.]